MTVKSAESRLCYLSRPRWRRPAFMPTLFLLAASWSFNILLLVNVISALSSHTEHPLVLWLILAVSLIVVGYLAVFTKKYSDDLSRKYEFELSDKEVVLRIDDCVSGRRLFAHMPFGDMSFVEHYTPRDNASLVFHGLDNRIIEVPVWSMTEDISPIMEILKDKHVQVVQL